MSMKSKGEGFEVGPLLGIALAAIAIVLMFLL